jgi:hypothetical protein
MALAFKLLQTHAAQILPAVTLQHLQRYFEHADKALASGSEALQLPRWLRMMKSASFSCSPRGPGA